MDDAVATERFYRQAYALVVRARRASLWSITAF
jgi:hypothetical protein